MKHAFVTLLCAALFAAGCRVSDIREMTVALPGLAGEADQAKITQAIESLPGIQKESLRFDLQAKTLTLRYDSMQVAHKNVEIAIAEAGYDANGIRAITPKP